MDYYKITLEALYKLLNDIGVKYWADWVVKDLMCLSTKKFSIGSPKVVHLPTQFCMADGCPIS